MGYLYVKLHAFLVVACTWMCGYFVDRSVPYFPIEISRTGTGEYSHAIFKWGLLSMGITLFFEGGFRPFYPDRFGLGILTSPAMFWPFVVLVAWFPDHTHFHIHNFFVGCMLMCVILNVCLVGDFQRRFPVVACALLIQGLGMGLKAFIVLFTELDNNLFDWRVYLDVALNRNNTRNRVVQHVFDIMYGGGECIVPSLTLPILRVSGTFQWMGFYILMSLY